MFVILLVLVFIALFGILGSIAFPNAFPGYLLKYHDYKIILLLIGAIIVGISIFRDLEKYLKRQVGRD
jgi:hypothetical protein